MDDLKGQAKKAFAWDFAGRMAGQVVSFIVSVVLARLLLAEDFGVVAIATVIIAFCSVFIDAGLSVSLIQRKEINDYHLGSAFWFNVFVGVVLTLGLFLSAPLLAAFYEQPVLTNIVRALSFLFVIESFGQVVNARLTRILALNKIVIAQFASAVISGILGVGLAYAGYGAWALVAQSLVGAFLISFLLIVLGKFKPVFAFRWFALKELWGFGLRMFLSGLLDRLYQSLDTMIIGKLFPPANLAFYNRAKNTKNLIINNAVGSLNKVLLPSLSSVQNDEQRFKRAVHKALHLSSFVSLLFLGFFFVVSNDFLIILLTEKWQPAVPFFRLILLSAYSYPISVILVNIIASQGNSKAFLRLEIYKKIVYTLNFLFGFLYGIEGFIVGLFIVGIIGVGLNIWYANKEIDISQKWFYKQIWQPFVLTAVIAGGVFYIFDFLKNNLWLHGGGAGGSFLFAYFIINKLLNTHGYTIFMDELKQLGILQKIPYIKNKL